ncbi:trehalase family protein [Collimonas fungivorans]|uniref:Putative periplasmic trehalase n=1 Tax=Collimonas fungivorans TaxID=158899 RepID=A0A127P539_9BURK|nr:alpha,alpha-trehalase TreF [Collimonas fungivorans]AMO92956.1 trehalase family protein [Collimonas fungivorans]
MVFFFAPSRRHYSRLAALILAAGLAAAAPAYADTSAVLDTAAYPAPPSELYPQLFPAVQMGQVFEDGKTFVDALPKGRPAAIEAEYLRTRERPGFALADFVRQHFELPQDNPDAYVSDRSQSLQQHIAGLWPHLTQQPAKAGAASSLLPLPQPYVVPGGRFREVYYWDSYFTMLGLLQNGKPQLIRAMVDNFASLIDRYGHIPNGNRSYYLSRSQPPFYFKMVGLLSTQDEAAAYARYLPQLRREYGFWMDGEHALKPGSAHRRVVALADGSVLNRYYDDRAVPRDESYAEDVKVARQSGRNAAEVYRDKRAGAESGWDFSSRWFADGKTLATIETTAILPVDLNSLLYGLENAIRLGCERVRDLACSSEFRQRADRRSIAVQKYLWDESAGHYVDYQWVKRQPTARPSAATLYPLFVGLAEPAQAARVAQWTGKVLLKPYGIVTTPVSSGQQWDMPNGWAPLQWIAVDGLNRYGLHAQARDIATRWMGKVQQVYAGSGKLVEKYDVIGSGAEAGGGEYALQDGFGWTNGVAMQFMTLYPELKRP